MADLEQTFEALVAEARETALLQTTADALEWDERTGMPPQAGEYRAEQVTLLRGMIHRRRTTEQLGERLAALANWERAADPHSDVGATIRWMQEDYRRDCRLPQQLVEALSRATVRGQQRWDEARRADDFGKFLPALEEIVRLKREAAAALARPGQSLYDALLDEYEPGAKAAELSRVFAELRVELVRLVDELRGAPHQPQVSILERSYPIEGQRRLSWMAAEAVGFDFSRGRLDETSHPFCTSLGPDDCRILTRYERNWFSGGLFGTLHEAGHGLYDQGLRGEWYGLPPGTFVSLGIHESQSRMWENLVGRSRAFWSYFYPRLGEVFPEVVDDVSLDDFHHAVNVVRPSLIRVEADEATYNLHIIVRFELEQRLLEGELEARDLPEAWNAAYATTIGITPPSDADGVLQDVHWSAGLIGYFPTYTLGNLYAAQLFEAAAGQLGDLDAMFARGEFAPLLQWLRQNIHRHGRCFTPAELIEKATGKSPESGPLIQSLRQRYAPLYGIG
ncbi:carboxypeptidase M32 [Candidatus Laterigemmans baculatus]|uniref:carboxypeptidase M32 n=1 Tax=Candidatus Laterigemmans baculatus TaxID=2770505 RepID=UPI0013DD50A3|nr:carboxypeptidase M32 [Candidatus Laterigemmans baculatus]